MITSANPSEGKQQRQRIWQLFCPTGEKVLLIDADMRKPAMHQMFQLDNILD